jgi:hypothetical protein
MRDKTIYHSVRTQLERYAVLSCALSTSTTSAEASRRLKAAGICKSNGSLYTALDCRQFKSAHVGRMTDAEKSALDAAHTILSDAGLGVAQ